MRNAKRGSKVAMALNYAYGRKNGENNALYANGLDSANFDDIA
jgi:hypothetical protein